MILTKEEILKAIEEGKIKIEPFDEKNLGPASYDVSLDSKIWIFRKEKPLIDTELIEENPLVIYRDYLKEYDLSNSEYYLRPGELVLGITKEKIELSEDICGFMSGRSRFARIGLMVHVSSSFIQPGVNNRQVFEIYNASRNIIVLKPNIKLAQIIFVKCLGKSKYKGIWANQ